MAQVQLVREEVARRQHDDGVFAFFYQMRLRPLPLFCCCGRMWKLHVNGGLFVVVNSRRLLFQLPNPSDVLFGTTNRKKEYSERRLLGFAYTILLEEDDVLFDLLNFGITLMRPLQIFNGTDVRHCSRY